MTPAEATTLLRQLRDVRGHLFLADDVPLVVGDHLDTLQLATHRQVTDAHPVALATRHEARLVTLDRGLPAIAGGADVRVLGSP